MNPLLIRDQCRKGLLKYTRQALRSIPRIENPRILDIGCGTGAPTLEIASLTDGHITAVDTDSPALAYLGTKIKAAGYEEKITLIHDSVFAPSFKKKQFDIIVAEGLFNVTGFEKGLRHFTPFLKDNGYFLIHDEDRDKGKKHKLATSLGYSQTLLLELDETVWWNDYCACLEISLQELRTGTNAERENIDQVFAEEIRELRMYAENPSQFRSVYYVLNKGTNDALPGQAAPG